MDDLLLCPQSILKECADLSGSASVSRRGKEYLIVLINGSFVMALWCVEERLDLGVGSFDKVETGGEERVVSRDLPRQNQGRHSCGVNTGTVGVFGDVVGSPL